MMEQKFSNISSFLSITPQMLSKIRKGITFDAQQ